jgi:AcrR family transcriptional regulator
MVGKAKNPSPTDGRELRTQGRKTMTALLDAGMEALGEKGYHAARVDDVVRIAGVSHGTFYLYFANKEDLFTAMAKRCAEETEALAATLAGVDGTAEGRDRLRAWLADFVALYRVHGVVIRAWAEKQVSDQQLKSLGTSAFGHITGMLQERLPPKGARTGPDLRPIALLALIERFSYVWISRDLGWSEDQMLDSLAGVIHRGFFQSTTNG